MNWCFAIVNNKLAEVYFERKKNEIKFLEHVYVKKSDFKTKRETKWIDGDTKRYSFLYRDHRFTDRKTGKIFKFARLKT